MLIDLHAHSSVSDGTQSPTDLVAVAAKAGVDVLALADHDTMQGLAEAGEAGRRLGVEVVPAIEVSTSWRGADVHLLAYWPDAHDAALAPMLGASKLQGGGAVVAMADMHAMGRPRKDFPAYGMSKAALIDLVRTLARALAPDVRTNAVAPGVVAWPEEGYESDQAAQQAYLRRVPLHRAGTPEDAAKLVAALALDHTYVNGEVIRLDGGRWLG